MTNERKDYLTTKYAVRWHWCTQCHCPSVSYTCCGNSTCNCGGCDKCDETYDEVREMFAAGIAPKIEDIPGAVPAQRRHDIGLIKNHLTHGSTREEEDLWLQGLKKQGCPLSIQSMTEITPEEYAAAPTYGDLEDLLT